MRAKFSPSLVPNSDQTVYLVADDFGASGQAWRETDCNETDRETVIQDLLSGEYRNPVQVIAFNVEDRWSDDVSSEIARELRKRCDLQMRDIPEGLQDFVDRYEGRYSDVQLPLPMRLF